MTVSRFVLVDFRYTVSGLLAPSAMLGRNRRLSDLD